MSNNGSRATILHDLQLTSENMKQVVDNGLVLMPSSFHVFLLPEDIERMTRMMLEQMQQVQQVVESNNHSERPVVVPFRKNGR